MVKKIILFIAFICLNASNSANSQNKCDSVSGVFGTPEMLPEFNIVEFIAENLKYPETAKKDKVEGLVVIRFWIDTLGYTSEHKIIKGIRSDLDKEALRVSRLIKFHKPAMNNNKPIGTCFQVKIPFRLLNKTSNKKSSHWRCRVNE